MWLKLTRYDPPGPIWVNMDAPFCLWRDPAQPRTRIGIGTAEEIILDVTETPEQIMDMIEERL